MFSLEPWTIRGCGYPDLLATGEVCDGEPIHDRQHPHDLFMELAAEYEPAAAGRDAVADLGGLVGEPALGPAAYPHRLSAMPNPLAPISHHWLDATHITFGVVTAGIWSRAWKVEGSAFNGREPDDHRRISIRAARFRVGPGLVPAHAAAGTAGLCGAPGGCGSEPHHRGPRRRRPPDRIRESINARSGRRGSGPRRWRSAATVKQGPATNALLVETSLALRERDTWFGRFEWAEKSADDLGIHDSDTVAIDDVAKLQLGDTPYFPAWRRLTPGFGGSVSVGLVPPSLAPVYGHRANPGIALFLTIRPAAHHMRH